MMEKQTKWKWEDLTKLFQKKNLLFFLGLAGIVLIFLSETLFQKKDASAKVAETSTGTVSAQAYSDALEERLTALIASVEGAGKTEVLITLDTSGETVYAQDERNDTKTQTDEVGVQDRETSYESEHTLVDGTVPTDDDQKELYHSLLDGAAWHKADHYFILLDYASYMEKKLQANRDYADRLAFGRKCLLNIASGAKFSSDRTIRQYAKEIWLPSSPGVRFHAGRC